MAESEAQDRQAQDEQPPGVEPPGPVADDDYDNDDDDDGQAIMRLEANIDSIFEGGCAREHAEAELLPATILFVLDRSSSMACNPPPITDSESCEQEPQQADSDKPSKWQITRAALQEAIAQLPDDTTVGLSYFSNDDSCGVHPEPSVPLAGLDDAQLSRIEASLGAVEPHGATPLVGAAILAYQHLHARALVGDLVGDKFVVLITDGSQSEPCSDPERCEGAEECTELLVDAEVARAAGPGVGIKTFVIGVPGSEHAREVLSRIALQGGTAREQCSAERGDCHLDMTMEEDLGSALEVALSKVAGRAVSCDLPVPVTEDGEVDLDLVNVIYSPGDGSDPSLVPQDTMLPCEGGATGWQYVEGGARIRLCGAYCSQVRNDGGARVDVVLGCRSRGPD